MQETLGYVMIILGLLMEIVSVLAWLGVLKPAPQARAEGGTSVWDLLLELLKRAPWTAVVGLLLIYGGLKMTGVALPF
jgi:hypothetical protein